VRPAAATLARINVAQLNAGVTALQQAGTLKADVDSRFPALTTLAFIMGLAHMEALVPELVGDAR
jgi:hypothetical protein